MWRTILVLVLTSVLLLASAQALQGVVAQRKSTSEEVRKRAPFTGEKPQAREYSYRILKHHTPAVFGTGSDSMIVVSVKNTSNRTWQKQGTVRLGCYWTNEQGERIPKAGGRARVRSDIPSGETTKFRCKVRAPDESGSFTLVWDMFEKGVGWFGSKGASPQKVKVKVR